MTYKIFSVPAGTADQTDLVQSQIDGHKDPLEIRFEAGAHPLKGLTLRSNLRLNLLENASLNFSTKYEDYAHTEVEVSAEQSNRAMIKADGAENIEIFGAGRIFCDGSTQCSIGFDEVMGTRIPMAERPRVMVLDRCKNVSLQQFSVEDSPMWTLHFVDCDVLKIDGLNIDNDRQMPNTDGIVKSERPMTAWC